MSVLEVEAEKTGYGVSGATATGGPSTAGWAGMSGAARAVVPKDDDLAEIEAVWIPGAPEGADAAEILTLSAGPPDLNGGVDAVALPDGRFLVAWYRAAYGGSQIVGRILTPARR